MPQLQLADRTIGGIGVGFFFFVAFALAWLITVPPALAQLGLAQGSIIPQGAGILIGLAPAIAAALAARRLQLKGFWRAMFRKPTPLWLGAAALLVPLAILALTYGVSVLRGEPIKLGLGPEVFGFALLWLVLAFGEEVGWRGFALPRLTERYGFWVGSLILGLVWCVWHYPRLLGSPYLGSFAEAAPLIALFSVQIVIANFIICWLYFRSGGSVIACTLFHTSFNVAATIYFLAATDLVFTAIMAALAAAIALFDRPQRRLAAEPAARVPAEETSVST